MYYNDQLQFTGNQGIPAFGEYGDPAYQTIEYMGKKLDQQMLHINVIDLQACNCANQDETVYNIAYQLMDYCNVDRVYGWDANCSFDKQLKINVCTKYHCDGYVKYYRDEDGMQRTNNVDFYFSIMFGKYVGYFKPKIHSNQST